MENRGITRASPFDLPSPLHDCVAIRRAAAASISGVVIAACTPDCVGRRLLASAIAGHEALLASYTETLSKSKAHSVSSLGRGDDKMPYMLLSSPSSFNWCRIARQSAPCR
jgi:hypothetical protein